MAVGAAHFIHIPWIFDLFRSERLLAGEAELAAGFLQCGIHADAFVEDEALSLPVGAAAFLEIFEDTSLELVDLAEAGAFQIRSGLLATDATGAEANDGSLLEFLRKSIDGLGEFPEVADRESDGPGKGAELHFVGVAGVEQGDGSPLVEPAFEFLGRQARGGVAGGINPLNAEGDDLLFELHQHPVEGLFITLAALLLEMLKSRDRAECREEFLHCGGFAGNEEIDPFGGEQNASLESQGHTLGLEFFA